MRYGSVCSGIEAATQAWHPLGWTPAFFSEIEKFPSAVLAHHYGSNMPDEPASENGVPNLGDMTDFERWPDDTIDILVGGTPCQSYSVAGLRKGLDDPRGDLMLTFGAIARRYQPRWLVWENVPGVLSSNGGRDFGTFLGLLGQLGYGFAYRVLDAQYVRTCEHVGAVPQRRRRVFVVGYIRDWRRAAAVLFDAESLQGNPAPRREAGQGFAGNAENGSGTVGAQCARTGQSISVQDAGQGHIIPDSEWPAEVAPTLNAAFGDKQGLEDQHALAGGGSSSLPSVANPLTHRMHKGINTTLDEGQTLIPTSGGGKGDVAHTLKVEGFDASEDGTGRGTPLVPVAFDCKGSQVQTDSSGVSPPLRSMSHNESHGNAGGHAAVAFAQNTRDEVRLMGGDGSISGKRAADPGAKQQSYVAFDLRGRDEGAQVESVGETDSLRAAEGGSSRSYVASEWAVRRLTPTECERLQAFPDGFTQIPWRGKPADQCPDGPRYKALGNSMAVNCMRWIGERIEIVEKLS